MTNEHALLGAILLDPAVIDTLDDLPASDFADRDAAMLYSALVVLYGAGFPLRDVRALVAELHAQHVPEHLRSAKYLASLIDAGIPSSAAYYAHEIRRAAEVRHLAIVAAELRTRTLEPHADPETIKRWLDAQTAGGSATTHEPRLMRDVANEWLRQLREPVAQPTAGTGMPKVDQSLGLWRPGELIVLAARPGTGKTALALQVAECQAARGRPVLFVSLEMRDLELCERAMARAAEIDGRVLRQRAPTSDELAKFERQVAVLGADPLHVWSPPSANVSQIRAAAKRVAARAPLSLVVVDYVSRVKPEDRSLPRHQQIAQVSWSCKTLAKEVSAPVLLLAQLNRESEKDTEPKLQHLAESGSIEQDADCVLFLHQANKQEVKLLCPKNRHGVKGAVTLWWEPTETRFYDTRPAREHSNYTPAFDHFNGEF